MAKLLFARKKKILPSPVIKQALGENPETGSRSGSQMKKTEKDSLKDEVRIRCCRARLTASVRQ